MTSTCQRDIGPDQPMVYQIRLKCHLGSEWAEWFGGMAVELAEDGDTLLTGPVADQAALYGLLKKMRDLGMPLVSVNRLQISETHQHQRQRLCDTDNDENVVGTRIDANER